MGLEPHETNRGGQNAAAPRREAQGQNRSPARKNQAHAPADPVVLPGARCRLCYRLVSKMLWTGIFLAPGNTATIQAIAGAFANQSVRVFADESHPRELRSDPKLVER